MAKEFCCTRPKLATLLMEKGYAASFGISPWNPKQHAWTFPMTPDLAVAVRDYYLQIGAVIPAAVVAELDHAGIK